MPINFYYDNGEERKVIGTLDTDKKEFSKKVTLKKHLFRKSDSWGVDAQLFTETLLPHNFTILITDSQEHIRYKTTAKNMYQYGTFLHFKESGKDHGSQILLPRLHFDKEEYIPKTHHRNVKKFIAGTLPKL